jgi:hypothetical protein
MEFFVFAGVRAHMNRMIAITLAIALLAISLTACSPTGAREAATQSRSALRGSDGGGGGGGGGY